MGRHDVMLVVIDHNPRWTDTEEKKRMQTRGRAELLTMVTFTYIYTYSYGETAVPSVKHSNLQ